ncbi:MAG: DUF5752 family protein [Gammaproteobacteria bacterium]|jgi:hypothetical protein
MILAGIPQPEDLPFSVKDCALISIATGRKAQNLKELREHLLAVESSSLYYHFWGGLLHAGFEEREYGNDFAEWIRHSLHDARLAERLAVIDPSHFPDLESMRQELVDVVEERLDEMEVLDWVPVDRQFQFIRSHTVVFDTRRTARQPEQLAAIIKSLSASSIFYHFIDARRRLPDSMDDFRLWLGAWGDRYAELQDRLAAIDPYFLSLYEMRDQVAAIFGDYFEGNR